MTAGQPSPSVKSCFVLHQPDGEDFPVLAYLHLVADAEADLLQPLSLHPDGGHRLCAGRAGIHPGNGKNSGTHGKSPLKIPAGYSLPRIRYTMYKVVRK